MTITQTQRRFLRNLRDHTGLRVEGARPHVLERRGLIARDGNTWRLTTYGKAMLEVEEGEW